MMIDARTIAKAARIAARTRRMSAAGWNVDHIEKVADGAAAEALEEFAHLLECIANGDDIEDGYR